MQTLVQDARYALRLLMRSPGFAATAIFILALAIGANAAIFSAVKGVLIAPLPYPDPDRLVRLFEENPTTPHFPMAPADFRDYRAELRTFDGIAAYVRNDLQIAEGDRPEQLRGMQVTSGFFKVVGWQPLLGREFEPREEISGNDDVVVVRVPVLRFLLAGHRHHGPDVHCFAVPVASIRAADMLKPWPKHTDDSEHAPRQPECPADNRRIAVEAPHPQCVTHHHDVVIARDFFLRLELSTKQCLPPDDLEEP